MDSSPSSSRSSSSDAPHTQHIRSHTSKTGKGDVSFRGSTVVHNEGGRSYNHSDPKVTYADSKAYGGKGYYESKGHY